MKSRMTTLIVILAMLVTGGAVMAKGHGKRAMGAMSKHEHTVYNTAKHDSALGLDKFTMWLDKAGLKGELDGHGAFTVFAPNDAAIGAMSTSDNAAMASMKEPALANAVKYYILRGQKLMAADLMKMDGQSLTMDNGMKLTVKVVNGKVMVGNTNVVDPDHACTNGVLHVVDATLTMSGMSGGATGMIPQNTLPMSAPTPMGTSTDSTMKPEPTPYGK
jgi:uncharacterized surface protein with fasciclin (FAS1) repeats